MDTLEITDFTAFESESEREEREAVQFHAGYFDDMAAFEGMGR